MVSGARCRLFAYGPADVTASPDPIIFRLIQMQSGFTFLVYRLTQVVLEKRPLNGCSNSRWMDTVIIVKDRDCCAIRYEAEAP